MCKKRKKCFACSKTENKAVLQQLVHISIQGTGVFSKKQLAY